MKLNFNQPIRDLKGEPMAQDMGELLAALLAQAAEGDVNKLIPMGIKLMMGDTLDLDKADQKMLKDFIEKQKGLTNLGKYRLLEVFDLAVEAAKADSIRD